jgi:hypothetical protein
MQFIVIPGPEGTAQVIETSRGVSETVRLRLDSKEGQAAVVPPALKVASFKFGSVAAVG